MCVCIFYEMTVHNADYSSPFWYCNRRNFSTRFNFVYFVLLAESTKLVAYESLVRIPVYVTPASRYENLSRTKTRER